MQDSVQTRQCVVICCVLGLQGRRQMFFQGSLLQAVLPLGQKVFGLIPSVLLKQITCKHSSPPPPLLTYSVALQFSFLLIFIQQKTAGEMFAFHLKAFDCLWMGVCVWQVDAGASSASYLHHHHHHSLLVVQTFTGGLPSSCLFLNAFLQSHVHWTYTKHAHTHLRAASYPPLKAL